MAKRTKTNSTSLNNPLIWIIAIPLVLILIFSSNNTDSSTAKSNDTPSSSLSSTTNLTEPQNPTSYTDSTDFTDTSATEPPVTNINNPITFISWSKTVARNEDATVKIKGTPNTTYYITVRYKSGSSTADGLVSKTSDKDGYVSWTWHIGGRTATGTFTITVTDGEQSETVNFTITD